MYSTSKQIINQSSSTIATTTLQKLNWILSAHKYAHNINHPYAITARKRYPHLQRYFNDYHCHDYDNLHQHLTNLQIQLTNERLEQLPAPPPDDYIKRQQIQQQRKTLQNWLSQWSTRNKQHYTIQIQLPDDTICTTTEQSAQGLYNHWNPTFQPHNSNLASAEQHLKQHIQPFPDNYPHWITTIDLSLIHI